MNRAEPSREERLAAKLRENLRRRKAQARSLDAASGDAASGVGAPDEGDSPDLPKTPPSR